MMDWMVGIAVTLGLIVIHGLFIFEGEFLMSIIVSLSIVTASGIFPIWVYGIVFLLLGFYLYQEFIGGEE